MRLAAPMDPIESGLFTTIEIFISVVVLWCLALFAWFVLYSRHRKPGRSISFTTRISIAALMLAACLQLYVLFTQLKVSDRPGLKYGTITVSDGPGNARPGAFGAIHKFYMAHRFRIWAHVCLVVAELVACYLAIKLTAPLDEEAGKEFSDDEERMPLLGEV